LTCLAICRRTAYIVYIVQWIKCKVASTGHVHTHHNNFPSSPLVSRTLDFLTRVPGQAKPRQTKSLLLRPLHVMKSALNIIRSSSSSFLVIESVCRLAVVEYICSCLHLHLRPDLRPRHLVLIRLECRKSSASRTSYCDAIDGVARQRYIDQTTILHRSWGSRCAAGIR
jgi:hypothetical protein